MPSSSLVLLRLRLRLGLRLRLRLGLRLGLGESVRVGLTFSVISYFFGGVGWLEKLEIKLSQLKLKLKFELSLAIMKCLSLPNF